MSGVRCQVPGVSVQLAASWRLEAESRGQRSEVRGQKQLVDLLATDYLLLVNQLLAAGKPLPQ